jgi:septum site-determining protein MinC
MPVSSAGSSASNLNSSFEIKSAELSPVALMLKTSDFGKLADELEKKFGAFGESPDFFDHDALVIDFSQLPPDLPVQDMGGLLAALRSCRLMPVAIRSAQAAWVQAARDVGLALAPQEISRPRPAPAQAQTVVQEIVREVVREVPVPGPGTLVIDKPLRSGQKVYARGADLIVLAMVNQGAEVVADGHIHVYAPLRGKAMAGASGNTSARIFSQCLEPELISIAGVYRTSENSLPAAIQGKPAQVRLSNDGQDKLLFEALKT